MISYLFQIIRKILDYNNKMDYEDPPDDFLTQPHVLAPQINVNNSKNNKFIK